MDVPVTKRLHISGLTPSITLADLSNRLGSFGTVENVDGHGALNAVGLPRKFAFVTLHTTSGKLAKCMNVLSGSTWKGAKLRLSEAKPDYNERLAAERNQPDLSIQKRKRLPRGIDGVHAPTMSLITPEIAKSKGGWTVTELGRVLSKVRMRPERPLPPTLEEQVKLKIAALKRKRKDAGKKGGERGRKRRRKDPVRRARRVTVDVTKWGSTQLKGIFLESQGGSSGSGLGVVGSGEESSEAEVSSEEDEDVSPPDKKIPPASANLRIPPQITPKPQTPIPDPASPTLALEAEKSSTLALLSSIFASDDDWIGKETFGSDVDEEEVLRLYEQPSAGTRPEDEDAFELVPRDEEEDEVRAMVVDGIDQESDEGPGQNQEKEEDGVEVKPVQNRTTSLKDLFASREEDAGFSLLGHLDIDLDLDEDFQIPTGEEAAPAPLSTILTPKLPSLLSTAPTSTAYINPREPLFFPAPAGTTKQKNATDVLYDKGWLWRDPSVAFYRTQSEEDVRKEWEEKRGALTREWKKRAREAVKAGRRRGKGKPMGAEGEGEAL